MGYSLIPTLAILGLAVIGHISADHIPQTRRDYGENKYNSQDYALVSKSLNQKPLPYNGPGSIATHTRESILKETEVGLVTDTQKNNLKHTTGILYESGGKEERNEDRLIKGISINPLTSIDRVTKKYDNDGVRGRNVGRDGTKNEENSPYDNYGSVATNSKAVSRKGSEDYSASEAPRKQVNGDTKLQRDGSQSFNSNVKKNLYDNDGIIGKNINIGRRNEEKVPPKVPASISTDTAKGTNQESDAYSVTESQENRKQSDQGPVGVQYKPEGVENNENTRLLKGSVVNPSISRETVAKPCGNDDIKDGENVNNDALKFGTRGEKGTRNVVILKLL